jgi:hypothetical protein
LGYVLGVGKEGVGLLAQERERRVFSLFSKTVF